MQATEKGSKKVKDEYLLEIQEERQTTHFSSKISSKRRKEFAKEYERLEKKYNWQDKNAT